MNILYLLICAQLWSLAVGLSTKAACNGGTLFLYADGTQIGSHDSSDSQYGSFTISDDAQVVAIQCETTAAIGGILGDFGDSYLTDATWHCSNTYQSGWTNTDFDDSSWSYATAVAENSVSSVIGERSEFPSDVKWIWTSNYQNGDWRVYCRGSIAANGARDNAGRHFILGYLVNANYPSGRALLDIELYISTSSSSEVSVRVKSPTSNLVSESFSITGGEVHMITVPGDLITGARELATKAIEIYATDEVVAYGVNKQSYSNDAFLALPVDALGTNHYAVTWQEGNGGVDNNVLIVGVHDDTTVTVSIPSTFASTVYLPGTTTYRAADTFIITLNKYDTYSFKALQDLTGTHIEANKAIVVYSGNKKTTVTWPTGGAPADHLVEQIPPVSTWGKKFLMTPIPARTTGDLYKIIASEDGTEVTVREGNNVVETINIDVAGGFYQLFTEAGFAGTVVSNKPVLLVQFEQSMRNSQEDGDPAMQIIPPVYLFIPDVTFATPQSATSSYTNFVTLVVKTDDRTGMMYNGELIADSYFSEVPGSATFIGDSFSMAKYPIPSTGTHRINHQSTAVSFGAFLYGFGDRETYATTAGYRLSLINQECVTSPGTAGDGIDNDCDGLIDEDDCSSADGDDCAIPVPVDGGWSTWSEWGQCAECGTASTQSRTRSCSDPAPRYNGLPCSTETAGSSESQSCTVSCDPVHGGFSEWSSWSECDLTTCLIERTRACNTPAPQFGGNDCVGDRAETADCETCPMPVTCWEHYTDRNAVWNRIMGPRTEDRPHTFYFGDMENDVDACAEACAREPNCHAYTLTLSTFAANWAGQCYGRSNSIETLVEEENIDCGVIIPCGDIPNTGEPASDCSTLPNGNYQSASSCNEYVTCRYGETTLNICPENEYFDDELDACDTTTSTCTVDRCSTGPRVQCSSDNEGESVCENLGCCWNTEAAPNCFHSSDAPASRDDSEECAVPVADRADCGYHGIQRDECVNTDGCCWYTRDDGPWCYHGQIDGGFSEWSQWSECNQESCESTRTRSCGNPAPEYGGSDCVGGTTETQECDCGAPVTCWDHYTDRNAVWGRIPRPRAENRPTTFYFGDLGDDVDACADACARETNCHAYTLHLTSFAAAWAGQCYGRSNSEETLVNEVNIDCGVKIPCGEIPGTGEPASDCDALPNGNYQSASCNEYVTCRYGETTINTCPENLFWDDALDACAFSSSTCNPAIDGGFSEWSQWSECNQESCESTRTRSCDSPAPEHGGSDCVGGTTEAQECDCAIDGGFSEWSQWSECNQESCESTRTRSCDNPAPEHGGSDCVGGTTETQECDCDAPVTCWDHYTDRNAVWGRIPRPRAENRPTTFYFGDLGDDVDACADACARETNCHAYTLHLTSFEAAWAGQCYGRSNSEETLVNEVNIDCGVKIPCGEIPGTGEPASDCDALPNGNYQSSSCNEYVTCRYGETTINTCPENQFWDDTLDACAASSSTCNAAIDGGFSVWSQWSECNQESCESTRTRSCDSPAPEHGGSDCAGDTTETQECDCGGGGDGDGSDGGGGDGDGSDGGGGGDGDGSDGGGGDGGSDSGSDNGGGDGGSDNGGGDGSDVTTPDSATDTGSDDESEDDNALGQSAHQSGDDDSSPLDLVDPDNMGTFLPIVAGGAVVAALGASGCYIMAAAARRRRKEEEDKKKVELDEEEGGNQADEDGWVDTTEEIAAEVEAMPAPVMRRPVPVQTAW